MVKNWSKKQTYLLLGVLLSVLIIYGISYLFIMKPLQAEKSSIDNQVSMFEKQLESVTNQTSGDLDNELIEVSEKVPNQPFPDEVLRDLREIASSANVVIEYIASGETSPVSEGEEGGNSTIQESSYTLDATASSLDDMNNFMDQMISQERLMDIQTINLQQTEGEVFLTISFTTFYSG